MQKSPLAKIVIIFVIALLIPVLSYTGFQLSQRNKDEEMIRSIYERQLDGILFSVNQFCWDQFHNESMILTDIVNTFEKDEIQTELAKFNDMRVHILGSFVVTGEQSFQMAWKKTAQRQPNASQALSKILAESAVQLTAAMRFAREAGYIRPHVTPWPTGDNRIISLVLFPIVLKHARETVALQAGLFIDVRAFVNETIARKFSEMSEGNFLFAVRKKDTGEILFPREPLEVNVFEKSSEVWIIPELELLIKLSGTTLAEVSKMRTRTNVIFLVIVNLMVLLGLSYAVKNISREMALANLKTDFVANVSHELRTPLALIRMYAETLEMDRVRSEEKKHHYYKTIMNETTRLTQLINNILDFSKIESHKKEYHQSPAELYPLIKHTLEMYRHHLEQHGFEIELDMDRTSSRVNIDGEAVTQAFLNLLDNAVKYSPEQKKIRVALKETGQNIVLSVQDHGMGIPEAEQKKIFEKFYRVGSSLVHNTKGSGLGLNLVQHIMHVHQGQVTVNSTLGEGSTFSLVFPKIKQQLS